MEGSSPMHCSSRLFPDWLNLPVVKGFGYFAQNDGLARGKPWPHVPRRLVGNFLRDGEGLFEPFSLAVCVGTNFETVVEIRATHPSGSACHRQAGISSAVVSRTRTPDLYARIDSSPVQGLLPTSLLKTRHAASLHKNTFAGGEDLGYFAFNAGGRRFDSCRRKFMPA